MIIKMVHGCGARNHGSRVTKRATMISNEAMESAAEAAAMRRQRNGINSLKSEDGEMARGASQSEAPRLPADEHPVVVRAP
jgi:hypothetical protein